MQVLGPLLLTLLVGCDFGLSAAATTRQPDAYCEPVGQDVILCQTDGEFGRPAPTWRCVILRGAWHCTRFQ